MTLLGEFGCFAYYFNTAAWFIASGAARFSHDPILSITLLLVTSVLAVFASKLLLETIELHFSSQAGERLLPQDKQRETALSLPFLLRSCLPDHCLGQATYLFFLVAVLVALLRTCMASGLKYYALLVDSDKPEELALEPWAVALLFVAAAALTASFTYQSCEYVQIACVFVNIAYAVLNATNPANADKKAPGSVLPRFMGILSLEMIIPSVMAASKVRSERHCVLIAWAIGLVALLYLALGTLIYSDSQVYIRVPEWVREAVALPCVLCSVHICMGVLVDVVVAWRYGLNLRVAQQHYPQRVRAVRLLLPFAVYASCFLFATHNSTRRSVWLLGSMLTVSLVVVIIPYCHSATLHRFAPTHLEKTEKWWKYGLYAGGLASMAATLYFFIANDRFNMATSLLIDLSIFGGLALWQVVGQFFQ